MSNVHVIIPAAGHGSRLGQSIPKQFMRIGDSTILEHIDKVFARTQSIQSVFIALNPKEKTIANGNYQFSNKTTILYTGGESRARTVLSSLLEINKQIDENDWVMVHDAARIGITEFMINQFIREVSTNKVGGIVAIPVTDTVKKINNKLEVIGTEDRDVLWLAQTPQMFRNKILKKALKNFQGTPTDEAEAVEALGLKPKLFKGNAQNFKITYPGDLVRAHNALHIIKEGKL
jgi:2-C-methyl-D-erythritol 4-phosphate cytidylyltransferase